jgi:bacteriorhodopsin
MEISVEQHQLVANFFSLTIAAMAAATAFLWINRSQVADQYKTAVTVSGVVTFIALYHYWRIYGSWNDAYEVVDGALVATQEPFNDAYRYVDWLLTVPLLLVELILVMKLSASDTFKKSLRLGGLAMLMIVLGYPGELSDVAGTRWLWWSLSMIPFLWIVYELFIGLKSAQEAQPESAKSLVGAARFLVIASWAFYPIVFVFPMLGLSGSAAETFVQIGYSVADIVSKAVFGILIFVIAMRKTESDRGTATL